MRRPKEASRGEDGEVLSLSAEVAAGTARRWERREEERAVEEQPEAALTKSSGGVSDVF